MPSARTATISRKTRETDIRVELCLDGGEYDNMTGVGFFDRDGAFDRERAALERDGSRGVGFCLAHG